MIPCKWTIQASKIYFKANKCVVNNNNNNNNNKLLSSVTTISLSFVRHKCQNHPLYSRLTLANNKEVLQINFTDSYSDSDSDVF